MAKNGKKGKEQNKEIVDQAIEKDERFSGVMKDPRFNSIKSKKITKERDSRFKFEKKKDKEVEHKKKEIDEEESSEEDGEMDLEMLRLMARGEISDMESSSDSEDEELINAEPEPVSEKEEEIEDGDATHRLACVNLNWDVVTATDLLSVFKSFSQGGSVYSVTIYPSDYGKKRLKEEEMYGPEGRIVEERDYVDDEEEEDHEKIDEDRLRKYEKDRMRYYFAVIDCDNKFTANSIYEQTDGTEFMRTGSIIDLRFIPDDMKFDASSIKEKATFIPENYSPSVTNYKDVNSHSNLQLSWDQEDKKRVNTLVKGQSSKKNEKGEIDYSNYLASSDEESSDDNEDAIRERYRSLIKMDDKEEEEEGEEEGDADITFIPGLKQSLQHSLEEKKKKEEENTSLSVYEAYKQKLKEKRRQKNDDMIGDEEDEDLFADLDSERKQKKQGKKQKKEKKMTEEDEKKKAELELLMIDEGNELKHNYDMNEIKKSIKQKEKKSKKRGQEEVKDDFEINTEDDRFKGLVTNTDFSIDVTNPMYVKTKGMEKLVNTVTKKRRKE